MTKLFKLSFCDTRGRRLCDGKETLDEPSPPSLISNSSLDSYWFEEL